MNKKIPLYVFLIASLITAAYCCFNYIIFRKESKANVNIISTRQDELNTNENELVGFLVNKAKLESNEDYINFALEGDKAEFVVRAVLNPALVERYGLKPVQINVKQDVYKIMGMYWKEEYIEKLWNSGSSMMPNEPFGFRRGDFARLMDAKNILVESKTDNKVIVTGEALLLPGGEKPVILVYTVELTKSGWKIESRSSRPIN